MQKDFNSFCYTSHGHDNWFFRRYYLCGGNLRHFTFQLALNMLSAFDRPTTIVETGCQRLENDIGDGMSTSVFGELCRRNGGKLYTVELSQKNLESCKSFTQQWSENIEYVSCDSVVWLGERRGLRADLLYLDSMDYDYGTLLDIYSGKENISAAIKTLDDMALSDILTRHSDIILPAQEHCLRELKAAFGSGVADDNTIVMIDDNQLPGGGKSRLAKEHLVSLGWKCLLDFQQTVWIKPPWRNA